MGSVKYQEEKSVSTGHSDLDAHFLFVAEQRAWDMAVAVSASLRAKWGNEDPGCLRFKVEPVASPSTPVLADPLRHYIETDSPSDRESFEYEEQTDATPRTSVLDQDEIEAESIVDWHEAKVRFERCHIDASIKAKKDKPNPEDTTGNWIPLPASWHDLYDGDTTSKVPEVSIAAVEVLNEYDSKGRQAVMVDVYLGPQLRSENWVRFLVSQLKSPQQLYDGDKKRSVYRVKVYKKEAEKFKRLLNQEHNKKVRLWSSVP